MEEENIPKHIAIIMDGNGRWAKHKGLARTAGHKQGSINIRKIALACNKIGVEVLTLYAFSTENWKRPQKEVEYLCRLPKIFFNKYIKELKAKNIKVMYIGELEFFPQETQKVILDAVDQTKENTGLILNLAINYGARREIVLAANAYAQDLRDGKITEELNEHLFSNYLMTKNYPDVDLLIRTSGEERISNFLLWQIAYAELLFTECSWPEFTEERLVSAIGEYQNRNRRFGGL